MIQNKTKGIQTRLDMSKFLYIILVLHRLGLAEGGTKTFTTDRGRSYTDTPVFAWIASKSENAEILTADSGRPDCKHGMKMNKLFCPPFICERFFSIAAKLKVLRVPCRPPP